MTQEEEQDFFDLAQKFEDEVSQLDLNNLDDNINFFTITKMLKLETKHSAFLAWLLDSDNEHTLGNAVVKKLFEKFYEFNNKQLFNYDGLIVADNTLTAGDVNGLQVNFSSNFVMQESDLLSLADSEPIEVETEVLTLRKKYIDILIKIPSTNTIVVIENKIDSTVHDDQLKEYQYEIFNNQQYANFKNIILLYLTPNGDDPRNKDRSFNKLWCKISYNEIRAIVEELLDELTNSNCKYNNISKQNKKDLIKILKDYMDMLDKNILSKSPKVLEKCYNWLNGTAPGDKCVAQIYQLLKAYEELPSVKSVRDYACEQLHGIIPAGCSAVTIFTVDEIENFYKKYNGNYDYYACYICCDTGGESKATGNIKIWINCRPALGGVALSKLEQFIKDKNIDISFTSTDGTIQIFKHGKTPLVTKKQRSKKLDDLKNDPQSTLNSGLKDFKDNILLPFLDILSKL